MKEVKGYIAQAGANKFGFYEISVGIGNKKFEKVGFGVKADTHTLDGVEIAKGLEFEGVVDETAYNKFVSGKVFKKEKPVAQAGGASKGNSAGKSGYSQVGMAMGGAVNRAVQATSTKIIKPKDAGPAALAQYIFSEMCIEAVEAGKVRECRVALTDVDVFDYDAMAAAYKAFKAAIKASVPAQEPPKEETKPEAKAPKKEPVKAAEAPKQELPEGFMNQEGAETSIEEEDLPF